MSDRHPLIQLPVPLHRILTADRGEKYICCSPIFDPYWLDKTALGRGFQHVGTQY